MDNHHEPEWRKAPATWSMPTPARAPQVSLSYWQIAWSHKLLMLIFYSIGAAAGTAYVIFTTPLYKGVTTVELVGFNQSFMGMNQVDPQAGTDGTTASASNIQTQTRILTSRTMLNRALERMNVEMTPVTSRPTTFFTKVRNRIPFSQGEPLVQSREAMTVAADTVSARGVGATRLIEMQCESTSPEVAASFVNTLAAEHISQALSARSNLTQRTSQWMESQLEEAKARLQQSGEKLRDFVRRSGMDFFPEQATLADSKLKQLQTDVSAIQADRIAKQAHWELAQATPLENIPDVFSDPTLQNLKTRIADLRREMAQLTATLMPEHYKVQRIQAQITEMEQTLEREKTGLLKRLQNEYEEALRKEKSFLAAYNQQTHTVSAQADKAAQYAMLKRDVEMQQQLYNLLLQQSNQAALIALAPASNIRVVDPAVPNPIPSSPRPVRDIPGFAMAGAVLGCGVLWLREAARRKKFTQLFDAPGHTHTILGVPELGVIPSAQFLEEPAARAAPTAQLWRKSLYRLGSPNGNGHSTPMGFDAWQGGKFSLLAESFRQTLVSILRAKPKRRNPVYVITSAGPGEGKSSIISNLGIAMAGIGQRVLLIDADLRIARLHELFGLKNRKGLSELLTSTEPLGNLVLEDYWRPTHVNNLAVLTHGVAKVETSSLFFSTRLRELVTLLRERFDCILVDTGPVLLFPDARLWGKHADGVVLVVRAGITTQEDAANVCQRFLEDGVAVLGTILNDWMPRAGSKGVHHYYSYGSYGPK